MMIATNTKNRGGERGVHTYTDVNWRMECYDQVYYDFIRALGDDL